MSLVVMAWRNLFRRKLRTGLTVAGIAVGVALILVLFSFVAPAGAQIDIKGSFFS
jgi:ABC-type antimicrobial peptide transport system permease subunit